jgi:hypothetical protein
VSDRVTQAGYKAPKVRAFLAAIRVCPSITRAAEAADIRRELHYRRYKADPVYKQAFDEAWQIGLGAVEDKAIERAQLGWEEPVIYQGNLVYPEGFEQLPDGSCKPKGKPLTIRKFSDGMHQFVLRANNPKYNTERHKHSVEVTDRRFAGQLPTLLALYQSMQQEPAEGATE